MNQTKFARKKKLFFLFVYFFITPLQFLNIAVRLYARHACSLPCIREKLAEQKKEEKGRKTRLQNCF